MARPVCQGGRAAPVRGGGLPFPALGRAAAGGALIGLMGCKERGSRAYLVILKKLSSACEKDSEIDQQKVDNEKD